MSELKEIKRRAPLSQETKDKIGAAHRGRKYPERSGINHPMFGKTHSPEARRKISESHKGRVSWNKGKKMSDEQRQKLSQAHKGVPLSDSHRKKAGLALRGANHWNWKGGITRGNRLLRNQIEYKEWRKAVFERDDYTCQECGVHGEYMQADHIKPFAYYPELRFELTNGRTLCVPCHRKTDTWGYRAIIQNSYVNG